MGKKIYSYNWDTAESGRRPVNYIIMWKPYDFLIGGYMLVPQKKAFILDKTHGVF